MKSEAAKAAAIIRKTLKSQGIAAKVRSENFAGGNSVNVTLTGNPVPAVVEAVTKYVNEFQYGHFNGMEDIYEYSNRNADIPQVKFAFTNVEYSAEIRAAARAYVEAHFEVSGYEVDQWAYRVLNGSHGDFWRDHKPRIRVAA